VGPPHFAEMLVQLGAQRHRRCIKSRLPRDALVINPRVRYLYVGRDARVVIWSMFKHHAGFTQDARDRLNGAPDCGGPPILPVDRDVRHYYLHWLEHDELPGFPMPSFWDHVRGWWEVRGLRTVLLLHFSDLIDDLEGQLRRVATTCVGPFQRIRRSTRSSRTALGTFFNNGTTAGGATCYRPPRSHVATRFPRRDQVHPPRLARYPANLMPALVSPL
jgi:hypothetical protein